MALISRVLHRFLLKPIIPPHGSNLAARGVLGIQSDAEAVDDARLRQTVGSANGIAVVAGTQEEAAISLKSTRSAETRKVSRSWADAEDSGSDGNSSSAGCDSRALHANVRLR